MKASEKNKVAREKRLFRQRWIEVVRCTNTRMKIKTVIILFLLIIIGCGSPDKHPCPTKTCSDYATQQQAQVAFDADKQCFAALDNDNDGIACEQLSTGTGSGTSCPTTSACGCSGKTKDQCSGPCCKWTVGSGCGCK